MPLTHILFASGAASAGSQGLILAALFASLMSAHLHVSRHRLVRAKLAQNQFLLERPELLKWLCAVPGILVTIYGATLLEREPNLTAAITEMWGLMLLQRTKKFAEVLRLLLYIEIKHPERVMAVCVACSRLLAMAALIFAAMAVFSEGLR